MVSISVNTAPYKSMSESNITPLRKDLLMAVYAVEKEWSTREFDCLIELIYDGTITTWEELESYGVEKPIN